MNVEQIKGALLQAVGRLQEKAGYAIGSREQQARGVARQWTGATLRKEAEEKMAPKGALHR